MVEGREQRHLAGHDLPGDAAAGGNGATGVSPAGKASTTVASETLSVPALLTVRWKIASPPTATGPDPSVRSMVRPRSTWPRAEAVAGPPATTTTARRTTTLLSLRIGRTVHHLRAGAAGARWAARRRYAGAVSATAPRGIGEIIVSSRPYDEYRAMFGLDERDVLAGPVLDCPGGAGSFAAGVRERGGEAVCADPAYALPPDEIVAAARAGLEHGIRYLGDNRESYVWTYWSSVDDLRRGGGPPSRPSHATSPARTSATSSRRSPTCPSPTAPSAWSCAPTCSSPTPTTSTTPPTRPRCASWCGWRGRRCASTR